MLDTVIAAFETKRKNVQIGLAIVGVDLPEDETKGNGVFYLWIRLNARYFPNVYAR
jgi:hypothetical protein